MLINIQNRLQLELIERGLLDLKVKFSEAFKEYCYLMNTQPGNTSKLIGESEDFQTLKLENEHLNRLLKQIEYQKRKLKK